MPNSNIFQIKAHSFNSSDLTELATAVETSHNSVFGSFKTIKYRRGWKSHSAA